VEGDLRIRLGGVDDAEAAVRVLEAAFAEDPFVRWLVGDRPRGKRRYFDLMLRTLALPRGLVHVAEGDGGLVGAALWAPPGTWDLGLTDSLRILPMMVEIIGIRRFGRISRHLEAIDAARPPEPRYLLTLVGTLPEVRGRGIGRRLLAPVLERCDEEGATAVLETSVERNLGFYQGVGFEVTREMVLDDGGPRLWIMTRAPG
jgi:GNAT superfamily N-acetyltransferase